MRLNWTNSTVKLLQLDPWDENPKGITKKRAKALLDYWDEIGQFQNLAIGPANGNDLHPLYDGHQRASVLSAAHGPDYEVAVRISSRPLTDDERAKMALMSIVGTTGFIDWDIVTAWDNPATQEWGLDADTLGQWNVDAGQLATMLQSEEENAGADTEPQIDKAEELRELWGVELGQMWQLGEHRLICGDCTDKAVVDRVMGGEFARLEFSDPPYDFETKGGGILSNSTHMDEIQKAGIAKFNPLTILLMAKTSVFCCNKQLIKSYIKLAEDKKLSWDLCFYKKKNTVPNYGGHLMTDTEYLPVIGAQSPNTGMDKAIYSKAYIGGLDENHSVAWQKPVRLVEKFIKLFSDNQDVVIDRFTCSGTTLIACENLNRHCRAVEIDPGYCAVTLQRYADHTGKTPVLVE